MARLDRQGLSRLPRLPQEEEDKAKVQKEIVILQERLQKLNESLARKVQARNEYDKTIMETEAAYTKILESAQTLLHVLKRESVHLGRRTAGSSGDAAGVGIPGIGTEYTAATSADSRSRRSQGPRTGGTAN
ncbi:sjoegren syndrome nuclear autoantigen 1 family protein [Cystoisospora suis]|uniref:Sjoegren syndrome nuclear autoantigen 1 family protein n=1 Tax=Cystoisospora suis TaxID=483139 RepID=A0A2C6JDZ8_9APIC|nr:sjoegren syndrome nuclear autoantigen 1 family protein [Cystoisospora suis]